MKLSRFSNQVVFSAWPKSNDKNLNMLGTKNAFKMKWKAIFFIFKGLSMKQITQIFFEGESLTLKECSKKHWAFSEKTHNYEKLGFSEIN